MRSIPANALTEIAKKQGIVPTIFVDIQWAINGPFVRYSASEIAGADPRILTMGGIDDVVKVTGNQSVAELTLTLDDSDGTLVQILNSTDIHFRTARVYQWFHGLALSDAFLLFEGQINSPIDYSEGERTLSLNILTRLEDATVGFAPSDGESFEFISDEYVDQPWPLAFGTVNNLPGQLIYKIPTGQTTRPLSMPDTCKTSGTLGYAQANLEILNVNAQLSGKFAEATLRSLRFAEEKHTEEESLEFYRSLARANSEAAGQANRRISEIQRQIIELQIEEAQQEVEEPDYGTDVGHVINGRYFPQRQLVTIKIGDALFTGRFSGDTFYTQSYENPNGSCDQSDFGAAYYYTDYTVPYIQYDEKNQVDGFVLQPVYHMEVLREPTSRNTYWFADGGSTVELVSDAREIYVANLLTSTIHGVYAKRGAAGIETLQKVPTSYYNVRYFQISSVYTATVVEMKRALSSYEEGWTNDQVYINLTSSVGPNTVDIMQWMIESLSDYSVDAASFAATKASLTNYPSHFALFDKEELFTLLEDIAFQCRCRIWLNDGVFYLQYLSAEPSAVTSITASDVENGSLKMGHTGSEAIVTEFKAKWYKEYSQSRPNVVTVRYNEPKYGTHTKEYDFFIYNIVDLVVKSAQFWAIRYGNTWKTVSFKGFLNLLAVETFDCVNFNLPGYFASGSVKALVEEANYDANSNKIDFQLWLPVLAGTTTAYNFAWPANVSVSLEWPTEDEVYAPTVKIETGDSFGLGDNILNTQPQQSSPSASFDRPSRPADANDSSPAQPNFNNDEAETEQVGAPPATSSSTVRRLEIQPEKIDYYPPDPKLSTIDIRSTRVTDSSRNRAGRLSHILQLVRNPSISDPNHPDYYLVVLWNNAMVADIDGTDVKPMSMKLDAELDFFRPRASLWLDSPDTEASDWTTDKAANDALNAIADKEDDEE